MVVSGIIYDRSFLGDWYYFHHKCAVGTDAGGSLHRAIRSLFRTLDSSHIVCSYMLLGTSIHPGILYYLSPCLLIILHASLREAMTNMASIGDMAAEWLLLQGIWLFQ